MLIETRGVFPGGRLAQHEVDQRQGNHQRDDRQHVIAGAPAEVIDHVLHRGRHVDVAQAAAAHGNPERQAAVPVEPRGDRPQIRKRVGARGQRTDQRKQQK